MKRAGPTGSHARHVLVVSVAQALNAFGSGIAPIAVAFALLGDRDGVAKFSAVLAVGALAPVVMTLAGVSWRTGDAARSAPPECCGAWRGWCRFCSGWVYCTPGRASS